MSFTETFIRRPVLATVVSLIILILGFQGFSGMAIRQYPEVEETTITVNTAYPGASADLIQGFITDPIAKAVSSTENVDYVSASSRQGLSSVSVRMRLGADPNAALTEVITKTQQVRQQLPSDAEDPIILKGTGQTFALMYLAFASDRMSPAQITEFLTRVIQPQMATVQGVASADILGGQNFAMRVWLDPLLLASRGVTAADVASAIQASNFLASPGSTQNELVVVAVQTETTLQTPEAFGDLPIGGSGGEVVRLRDVAKIELGADSTDVRSFFNGSEGVFIGITPTPEGNPLTTADTIKTMLPSLQQGLPEGMKVNVVYDSTVFIQASIDGVFETILEAVIIVIIVIYLFLGSFRSVIIPIVTIPLALVGICFVLFGLGYSINLLTLLAMVLAIGLVVDDAIVVVENIHRHIEEGIAPIDAAILGIKEIFVPVITMTITLAAVYAPIGFTQGLTGALFREFSFTLAGAVIISGFVAITLSPMMSARLLQAQGAGRTRYAVWIDRQFDRLTGAYGRTLNGLLNMRVAVYIAVAMLLGTTAYLFLNTRSELAPAEDQGALFTIVTGPRYATSDYMEHYIKKFPAAVGELPESDSQFQIIGNGGTNSAIALYRFTTWANRERSAAEILPIVQEGLSKVTGVQAFVVNPPSLPGSAGGLPVQYVIRSIGSPELVYEIAQKITDQANVSGKFLVVQNSLAFDKPQAVVKIDRERAASLGVSISAIGTTLNVMLSNGWVSRFDLDNRSYEIIPQAADAFRLTPENMGGYYVRSQSGAMVPLSAVTTIVNKAGPVAIEQFNQLNSATISAMPMIGSTTDDGLQALRGLAAEVMPEGFYEDYAGESRLAIQEGNSLAMAFGLAIIIIYLVLAAQFESFRDPFIIMIAVPLSLFGAILFLNLGFATLNIYTQVGLITLIGLITKHGILMVEFANERRAHGVLKREAITEAAEVRLRPILMTTSAMVLGVLPLITASGAGAASRYSIGLVIATGMSIGTIFTLFVVPSFYLLIAKPDPKPAAEPQPEPQPIIDSGLNPDLQMQ
ncbi:Efflux pump membrane transporter BepE [Alphaproteobacteria bacterium SO-S41]|nr:Efflux pump membrane transporter BepE [Alphaproteobacteria bacterium SO-S41]